jgi:hypothetical protein
MNFPLRLSFPIYVFAGLVGWNYSAHASFYNFQCPNRTEVEFYNQFDATWIDGLRFIPTGPTVLRIESPGGPLTIEESAINQLEILANQVTQNTGTKLQVIVTTSCASACTIFTAGLNQLAGQGQINLLVDTGLQLGFHAASDEITGQVEPTSLVYNYYSKYGVSIQWLNQNQAVFSTTTVKWVAPIDPWLASSGLLTHAVLASGDTTGFPIPSSANCTAGPTEY